MNDRAQRAERLLTVPMLIAALLVVPVIVVEESSAGASWQDAAGVVNWAIWIAFALEAGVTLALVDDKLRWIRTHPLEVAIVVLTPPVLPASLQALRAFRLLRLLRLLRAAKLARNAFSLSGLRYSAFVVVLTALAAGAAYSSLEEDKTTWDGIWWAITTMTTVGYGDISPATVPGRLLAISLMFIGIGFIAILTGAIAERFLASQIDDLTLSSLNPRQQDRAVRLELTAFSKGPVIRAEAAAADKMSALDLAVDKMAAQMRRAADRRRPHYGRHAPARVGASLPDVEAAGPAADDDTVSDRAVGPIAIIGEGPLVVREKTHVAVPMTLDQALYEMELVGHDFYLFVDKESERPSVVYRRRGYDYGVISLDVGEAS